MGNPSHPTQECLAVTIRFEPTRFAPDTLQAAYARLLPRPHRKVRAARDRLAISPRQAGEPAEGAGNEYVAGGPVRAGIVRATG